MSNGDGTSFLKHAPLIITLIGATATVVTAYMTNKAHIEDLQQRVTALELRLDRLTERK